MLLYKLPPYSILRVSTLNLEAELNRYLGRYSIKESNNTNSLKILIARTNVIANSKTKRDSEKQVIIDLVNEFRSLADEEDEKNKSATLILLGALLHRYYRLINWHEGTFWATSPLNSDLFNSIRYILKLNDKSTLSSDEIKIQTKTYKKDDAKILDPVTVYSALKAFQSFMTYKDEHKKYKYLQYTHFVQDENFESHLQEMINDSAKRALPLLNKYKPVKFLVSCVEILDNEVVLFKETVQQLIALLKKDNINLSKTTVDDLVELIKQKGELLAMKEQLIKLVLTEKVEKELEQQDYESFPRLLTKCFEDISSYTLLAAYLIVNEQLKSGRDTLYPCMRDAIALKGDVNDINLQAQILGLESLQALVKLKPDLNFECEFFGNQEQMIKVLYILKMQKLDQAKKEAQAERDESPNYFH